MITINITITLISNSRLATRVTSKIAFSVGIIYYKWQENLTGLTFKRFHSHFVVTHGGFVNFTKVTTS